MLQISNVRNTAINANNGVSPLVLGVIGGLSAVVVLVVVVALLILLVKRLRQRNVNSFVRVMNLVSRKHRVHAERLVCVINPNCAPYRALIGLCLVVVFAARY